MLPIWYTLYYKGRFFYVSIFSKQLGGDKHEGLSTQNGKLTVKKGLKKGTYKVTIKVRAAGNSCYNKSAWKKLTTRIKVR